MNSDINKMSICTKIHKWFEPVQCVWCNLRERLNIPLQLQVLGVEHCV
jgi:hypothetical protein